MDTRKHDESSIEEKLLGLSPKSDNLLLQSSVHTVTIGDKRNLHKRDRKHHHSSRRRSRSRRHSRRRSRSESRRSRHGSRRWSRSSSRSKYSENESTEPWIHDKYITLSHGTQLREAATDELPVRAEKWKSKAGGVYVALHAPK